jgi:hypothetical protein
MTFRIKPLAGLLACAALGMAAQASDQPHNVILFVPDGLRSLMVRPDTAPAMAQLRDSGVTFSNSHSLFPTLTTANASGFATGHYLGDTGDYSNTIYVAYPVANAGKTVTPFLEDDAVLGDLDEHFSGNYLNADAILRLARNAGYNTAAIGKLGPVLIFDHTERSGQATVIADDATGSARGMPLAQWVQDGLAAAGLPDSPPSRGDNGKPGNATMRGTLSANVVQQQWFSDLFNKLVLTKFKHDNKPFVAVFWSRDPDGSQHNQGDSLNQLTPGINGPTTMAAIKNADNNLAQILAALKMLGLDRTTDVIVSADHGFSTISKQSATSPSAREQYDDVPATFLPPGFLAKDLALMLGLPLWDPDRLNAPIAVNRHPKSSNGVLGTDPQAPLVVVAANGGSDLIYLPQAKTKARRSLTSSIIKALLSQDYVSGLFVDARLGKFPGTLSTADINLQGTAATPAPSIVVNFKSFADGCAQPSACSVDIADTGLQQGQGIHGSFSRGDTFNFTAAYGPDFKQQFVDRAPVSNADVGRTIAAILKLDIPGPGKLLGRVISEAMPGGLMPTVVSRIRRSAPSSHGLSTVLRYQQVGATRYFDVAGFPGRTLGLDSPPR